MKKVILSAALFFIMHSESNACGWYDPDYEYFNLFTQSIIKDKTYLPFLHTYSTRFYGHEHFEIHDENIESWQKYFGNKLNYLETKNLVEKTPLSDLNAFKKGNLGNSTLSKLGSYQNYAEAIDYLIEAKYLEPYMKINYVASEDSFYYQGNETEKNATSLDYNKTITALTSLYNAAKNPEIKQRYGFQLVRFNHYTRNYDAAVQAFKTYVQSIPLKGSVYFMALDQLAGAQRGLNLGNEANWNFFQVFKNSKSRKESAFISMKLSDTASFNNIMKRAGSNDEKNMAYFLLGYEDFSNPIPMMEKMYDIDPNSEILKVLAARSINELERNYLPTNYYQTQDIETSNEAKSTSKKAETIETKPKELSFWQKIVLFFKNLFGSKDKTAKNEESSQNDDELLSNPNRIPFYSKNQNYYSENENQQDFLEDLQKFTSKTKEKSQDEFWQIADAYLQFLKKDYKATSEILSEIKTSNPEYLEEIKRMKVLNDIVSQPKIDADFENHIMNDYPEYFAEKNIKKDSTENNEYDYLGETPSTADFLKDILANRYLLQGENGKSFLMNNKLSDLQYNPNSSLVKSVEDFYRKPNKTKFEEQIIAKNINNVGNIEAFFNVIYGDRAMRLADFEKAKSFYQKAKGFSGIPRENYETYNPATDTYEKLVYTGENYDGFSNISNYIFGHNVWESFESTDSETMKAEDYTAFPLIKPKMNKLELAEALVHLKKIGSGKDAQASQANQLIGNLLYNTSILGYYREVFVMDVDNSNGEKFHFYNTERKPFQYYYKNFSSSSYIEADHFELAIDYYKKALVTSKNQENNARILFQMASAEQGKYYQYETTQSLEIDYADPKWSEKNDAHQKSLDDIKNQKYRTYFAMLQSQYSNTETAKNLMGSCSYFGYFMRK